MTSPDDISPPPPEPLPERRKQEMRHQLLAAATSADSSARGSWLVPALAAAAVLAIVGAGAVVLDHDGDGGEPGSVGLQPAGRGGPVVPGPGVTTATATAATHAPPPRVRPGTSTVTAPAAPYPPTGHGELGEATTCQQEIDALAEPSLDGATVTADRDYGAGVTSLFETKSGWIVCDTWATIDGGAPTLFSVHEKSGQYEPNVSTLAVSENFGSGDPLPAEYVAGGRDFDGVQAIAYTFPDGHVEDAVVGQTGLWSMVYLPTSGVLTDLDQNEATLDPITVRVSLTNGDEATYTLQWGEDTCAQINHGC